MALPDDLVLFASAAMPEDDSATSGGAIDLDVRLEFTQLASSSALEVLSSAAGDTTQQVTVEAVDTAGAVVSQTVTLSGVTPVDFSTLGTVAVVLQVSMNADATGIVTLRVDGAGATVGTIPIGERGFLCMHREATASSSSAQDFYYKAFWKNTGAGTLLAPVISEYADPAGRVTFAVAASINDSGSVTNRKTAPGGLSFSNSPQNSPANLAAGDAIGVWFKWSHPAGDSEFSSTLSNRIAGAV